LVLGIPRGGVIVADIVAKKLNADFDIVIPRKLTAPDNKENAIGAVMEDGSLYLDDFLVNSLKISQEYIEKEKQEQLQEIERRKALFRPPSCDYDIKDRSVVLVDDGIATGATVIAAARWIRKQQPKQLIIAAPVAQPQAADLLKNEREVAADAVEIISTPSNFGSVNQFYQNFDQVTDERVIEILKNRNLL
jgi:predicted phosphoribosyltransferase